MENFIYPFIKNIAFFSILTVIIMNLLPSGTYRKYMQLFIGFVLILLVLSPIGKITKMDLKMEQSYEWFNLKVATQELDYTKSDMEEKAKEVYLSNYQTKIQEQMKELITEDGFVVQNLTVDLEESGEDYGKVKEVSMTLKKSENEGITIDTIEVGKTKMDKKESVKVQKLKKSLEDFYELDSGNINIEIQG